ncbi:MAG: RNA 3'-terminal phosphate cyclase [Thaumarchaeota archaeon]|nr:RNA 3'-terminal phosphate cyclase [Nitrososphaerota archaeon]
MEFLEIDGSFGEGGGQIVRTAVAFSAIKSLPVRVRNIRAGRRDPGLKAQHASALRILAQVFEADLEGASEGSTDVSFAPGAPHASRIVVDARTAASITLVLQAVVPAVSISRSSLELELRGGTDVPWSPTLDYLTDVASPLYRSLGIKFDLKCLKRGYYPVGGGSVEVKIESCDEVSPVDLTKVIGSPSAKIVSRCAALPRHVAERQAGAAVRVLTDRGIGCSQPLISEEESGSPGSSVLVRTESGGRTMGADSIGARGKPAEEVGKDAATRFAETAASGAAMDFNVADMVAPWLSLAREESVFTVPSVTAHLRTGLHLAELFTGCSHTTESFGKAFKVKVIPK